MALSNSDFKKLCEGACAQLRSLAPYDTGNLSQNAIRIEFPSPSVCLIYVDESIAPYMPFTTRPWISPRWKGRKNPNEGWWQAAGELIVESIAQEVQGEITKHG